MSWRDNEKVQDSVSQTWVIDMWKCTRYFTKSLSLKSWENVMWNEQKKIKPW